MAVYAFTSKPKQLLRMIKEAIENNKIDTWSCDSDGDFTHSTEQWKRKAWLRPKIEERHCLVFTILPPKDVKISRSVYGIYHGRFAEMLLVHFDEMIENVTMSAMPSSGDRVG